MTVIVEQAARVLYEHYSRSDGLDVTAQESAQALADAGLLREPVTTILEEFVVPCPKCNPDEGRCLPCREEADTYYRAAINAISTYSAAKELARDGDSDAGGYVGRDLRELAERIKQHLLEHPEPPARTVPTRDVYELAAERITAESTWTVDAREALGLTRTVPTRERIADVLSDHWISDPSGGTSTGSWCDCTCGAHITTPGIRDIAARLGVVHQADAVLALLADQPTVNETKAQTPEPRIEWKRGAHDWTRGPLPPRYETAPVEAHATCAHCGTVTVTKFTAPGRIPQPLLKCDCQQYRDGK